jgi:small subunit ribosomal protein S9
MEAQTNTEQNNKKVKLDFKDSKYATGRRKRSIAKVWLKKGTGNISINGKTLNDYFKKQNLQMAIFRPFTVVKRENEFDIKCSVKGGGLSGQAGAIILGIARAIVKFEPELKSPLKKNKLTTRDSRVVERKKYGRKKARRSFQFSKR